MKSRPTGTHESASNNNHKTSDDDLLKDVNISSSYKLCAAGTERNLFLVSERWETRVKVPKEEDR